MRLLAVDAQSAKLEVGFALQAAEVLCQLPRHHLLNSVARLPKPDQGRGVGPRSPDPRPFEFGLISVKGNWLWRLGR